MNTLCFRLNGKPHFVAISPEIDKQIRVFTNMADISHQEMAEFIYKKFGIVSQTSIIRYLKYWADSNKCPRCYGIGKIIDKKTTESFEGGDITFSFGHSKLIVCPQCEGKSVQNTTQQK